MLLDLIVSHVQYVMEKACSNKIPGPGAKEQGQFAIKNYDAWQKIEVKMDTLAENKEIDTTFKMFGKSFKYPYFAGPVGAVSQHYMIYTMIIALMKFMYVLVLKVGLQLLQVMV